MQERVWFFNAGMTHSILFLPYKRKYVVTLQPFLIIGMMICKISNQSANPLPKYATRLSAGVDLYANLTDSMIVEPMQRVLVPTGYFLEIPEGYEAQVRPRSGLAIKHGITVLNSPGTIDADYRGEIKVILINLSDESFEIKNGERIAQMVFARCERVEWQEVAEISDTERGAGGFGSSGK